MSHPALDKFGEKLVEHVRDWSILQWDMTAKGEMKDTDSEMWHSRIALASPKCQLLLHDLIPEIVDTTIHHFLSFLETQSDGEAEIKISMIADNYKINDLVNHSDGFCGELQTEYGWIKRFSKERRSKIASIPDEEEQNGSCSPWGK